MTPARARALLLTYFGQSAVDSFDPLWPETLLEIASGTEHAAVISALRSKVATIDRHENAASDEAELLKHVLKSVAAQMIEGPGAAWSDEMDAALAGNARTAAIKHATVRVSDREHVAATEQEQESPEFLAFREAVLSQLAEEGMTDATLPRLHMLAAMHELPPSAVDAVLVDVQYHLPTGAAHVVPLREESDVEVEPVSIGGPERDKGPSDAVRLAVLGGAAVVGLVLITGAGLAAYSLLKKPAPPVPAPAPTPAQTATNPSTVQPNAETPKVEALPPVASIPEGMPDGRVLLRDLRSAVKAGPMEGSDRLKLLSAGTQKLRSWWPRLEPSVRTASVEAIVEGAYIASKDDALTQQYLAAIGPGRDGVVGAERSVWSDACAAGLLTRLMRERELPRSMAETIERKLASEFGGTIPAGVLGQQTFGAGVLAWLRVSSIRIVKGEDSPLPPGPELAERVRLTGEAASQWHSALVAQVGATQNQDAAERLVDTLTLEAIERALVEGPELLEHRAAYEVVGKWLATVKFREGDSSRDRLLGWLGDMRISIGDIHVVTSILASRSGSSAVAPNMVLSPSATAADRDTLRAEYKQAWALTRTGPDSMTSGPWLDRAKNAETEAAAASDDIEQLTAAVMLAQMNKAAAERMRGQMSVLPEITPIASGASGSVTTQALASGKLIIMPQGGSDGEWAKRYLGESRSANAKLACILDLGENQIGPIDCEVLAEVALSASGELRSAAQKAALSRSHQPAMINAVLEYFPRAPRSSKNGEFLANLTMAGQVPYGSEQWTSHYRRALVEKFLQTTAASNFTVAADRHAATLAISYAITAGHEPAEITEADGPVQAVEAAESLFEAYRTQAKTLGATPAGQQAIADIEFRKDGRLLVANGLVQQFAAYQVSAAEMLGMVVTLEKPVSTDDCRAIVSEMQSARAGVSSVTHQLRIVEHAMMKLWALRLGEKL